MINSIHGGEKMRLPIYLYIWNLMNSYRNAVKETISQDMAYCFRVHKIKSVLYVGLYLVFKYFYFVVLGVLITKLLLYACL
jgi:hypothetical protein